MAVNQAAVPLGGAEPVAAAASSLGQPAAAPTLTPLTLRPQLQAMSQLLDVLEQRSQDVIQQETAALAQVVAKQNLTVPPRSPTRTAVSQRKPLPDNPIQVEPELSPELVVRHKHCGKPLTPSSPPGTSSSSPEPPSSDSSSSSWEYLPKKKKKGSGKHKGKESRTHPSPSVTKIAETKIPKTLEKPPQLNT